MKDVGELRHRDENRDVGFGDCAEAFVVEVREGILVLEEVLIMRRVITQGDRGRGNSDRRTYIEVEEPLIRRGHAEAYIAGESSQEVGVIQHEVLCDIRVLRFKIDFNHRRHGGGEVAVRSDSPGRTSHVTVERVGGVLIFAAGQGAKKQSTEYKERCIFFHLFMNLSGLTSIITMRIFAVLLR